MTEKNAKDLALSVFYARPQSWFKPALQLEWRDQDSQYET
jgi:hypothetical protein